MQQVLVLVRKDALIEIRPCAAWASAVDPIVGVDRHHIAVESRPRNDGEKKPSDVDRIGRDRKELLSRAHSKPGRSAVRLHRNSNLRAGRAEPGKDAQLFHQVESGGSERSWFPLGYMLLLNCPIM